jgi:hypothetical protein
VISEPELVGGESVPPPRKGNGGGAAPGSEVPGGWGPPGEEEREGEGIGGDAGAATVLGDDAPPPTPRRTALTWGFYGALVASALWAAGLYVYDTKSPDLGGYRGSGNLCLDARLSHVSLLLGPKQSPRSTSDEGSSLDQAACSVDLGPAPMDSPFTHRRGAGVPPRTDSLVEITYVLHKKTDPGPEFDAIVGAQRPDAPYRRVRIGDLGERAYLLTDSGGQPPVLMVLDGQAEFTVRVRSYNQFGDAGGVELASDVLEPALVHDVKDLMATLKKG